MVHLLRKAVEAEQQTLVRAAVPVALIVVLYLLARSVLEPDMGPLAITASMLVLLLLILPVLAAGWLRSQASDREDLIYPDEDAPALHFHLRFIGGVLAPFHFMELEGTGRALRRRLAPFPAAGIAVILATFLALFWTRDTRYLHNLGLLALFLLLSEWSCHVYRERFPIPGIDYE